LAARRRPARAGMDPSAAITKARAWTSPRASGDGPPAADLSVPALGVAPRERGWTLRRLPEGRLAARRPARAGMDPQRDTSCCATGASPRASGDGPAIRSLPWMSHFVAPRERGWTLDAQHPIVLGVRRPARAGMDPDGQELGSEARPSPRASGDGPSGDALELAVKLVAPRERGWTLMVLYGYLRVHRRPARAGMDRNRSPLPDRPHPSPRASGDGPT